MAYPPHPGGYHAPSYGNNQYPPQQRAPFDPHYAANDNGSYGTPPSKRMRQEAGTHGYHSLSHQHIPPPPPPHFPPQDHTYGPAPPGQYQPQYPAPSGYYAQPANQVPPYAYPTHPSQPFTPFPPTQYQFPQPPHVAPSARPASHHPSQFGFPPPQAAQSPGPHPPPQDEAQFQGSHQDNHGYNYQAWKQNAQTQRDKRQRHFSGPNGQSGVQRSATSVQYRPMDLSSNRSMSRPTSSKGSPVSPSSDSFATSTSTVATSHGVAPSSLGSAHHAVHHKRKASQSIEPSNALAALHEESIWLPGDDADSHFLTTGDFFDQRLSLGTILWRPGHYPAAPLPSSMAEFDHKTVPFWTSPRGNWIISEYLRPGSKQNIANDLSDPVHRDLTSDCIGVPFKQARLSCRTADLTEAEVEKRYGIVDRFAKLPQLTRDDFVTNVADDVIEHQVPVKPARQTALTKTQAGEASAKENVAVLNNEEHHPHQPHQQGILMAHLGDDDERYTPPPAHASLPIPYSVTSNPPASSRPQSRGGLVHAPSANLPIPSSEKQLGPSLASSFTGTAHKRQHSETAEAPNGKRARAGSASNSRRSFKERPTSQNGQLPEPQAPRRGSRHRRNSSVEAPKLFTVDTDQEAKLAALGVTGTATNVFNMPGPARGNSRSPSRGTTPQPQSYPPAVHESLPPPPPPPPYLHAPETDPQPWQGNLAAERPSSRASDHTAVGSEFGDSVRPKTPEPAPKDALTPIRESPEDPPVSQKTKRMNFEDYKATKGRQRLNTRKPFKPKPNVPAAYERRW